VKFVESVAFFAILMPIHSIAPVILAAGDSMRMGYPKALLPLGNDIFLNRILKTVRDIGLLEPTVILGKSASIIKPHIDDSGAKILINPDPDRGQLSSIQIALTNLGPEIDAALIWPVDIPAVPADLVRRLAELFLNSDALISFPVCGDKRGHPAIFHRSLFREFIEAPLAEGPQKILLRHNHETSMLAVQESATIKDIDTPSDYEELTGETLDSALARRRS
jgi:molybdenum cofactor cytidylyltransferase